MNSINNSIEFRLGELPEQYLAKAIEVYFYSGSYSSIYNSTRTCLELNPVTQVSCSTKNLAEGFAYLICQRSQAVLGKIYFRSNR